MATSLKGRKGSSTTSRKATRHDDSLFGTDTVEALLAISEGPIQGLKDGASTFYVGDVPLLDKGTQTPNISNFELRLLKGTNPADSIRLNLGGLASSKNIGLELRTQGQSIVAQGDKTQIDFLDVRFVVQRLLAASAEGGEFPIDVKFQIEVKPRNASVWQIPFTNEPAPPVENTSGASNYRPGSTTPGTVVNDTYRETYLQADAPTVMQASGAMWFNTGTPTWEPRIARDGVWVVPNGLAQGNKAGYAVWIWSDDDGIARTAYFSPTGTAPPPGTLSTGDFLLTPQAGEEVYSYNETAWVGAQDFGTPAVAAPGVIQITGLTRSAYPKEYRIPVARINQPYDVRVTRLSPASTKTTFQDLTFESIQEVSRDVVSFPDLAIAWLTIKATDTFTSVPEFTGIYRGVLIPVPSNHVFNEVTNLSEFPGLWDGTFKIAYTNNPAWHAHNFIKNARYGKNAYFPEVPDQWDFYEFGKHCSRHGFRFNEYIQEPRSINELINYIVGIAGGRYVDRGDGYSTVIWDADDQVAQAIFAPENTIEGAFIYSFTDATERKNDFKVSFKNPQLNFREDRLRVYDQNTIDVVGRNAEEFVAVGCRDADEAVRRGRLRLATALSEKIIVNFKTNRIGRYLLPFQVILVADDQSTNVISGRIKNAAVLPAGSVRLPLRDQIYLEAAVAYTAQFTISDGNGGLKVVSYPLTVPAAGLQSELILSQALAEPLPEYAVFSIGAPKPFRITSITQADDDPDQLEITAIEVHRLKWAFVRGEVELRDITALQTGALSKFVYPVTGAKITPESTLAGGFNLIATWNPTETKLNRGYRVYQSINMGPMQLVGEPNECFYRVENAQAATYILSIVAVGLDGTTESAPVSVSYVIANGSSIRSVGMPSNLRLVNEPEAPLFRAINPQFTWDAAADPLVSKYLVEVLNGAGQAIYSERVQGQLLFAFTLAQNMASNGGMALRQFTVRVRSIDSTGSFSEAVSLVVSHPPPPVLSFDLDAVSETVFVRFEAPAGDWQGTLVWMETTSGFNPLTTPPKYDGTGTFVPLPAKPDTTYYIRIAAYDSYGKAGLNISGERSIFTSIKLFDPNGPSQPTGLTLSTESEIQLDGTVTAVVRASWDPPLASDAAYGQPEVSFGEGVDPGVDYISDVVPADQRTWERHGLRPGIPYSVMVRYLPSPKALQKGPYTLAKTIIAAKNLTPPVNPTGVSVVAGFERTVVRWTLPTTKDLKWIEVWSIDGASTAGSPLAGAIQRGVAPAGDTQFWDSLPTTGQRTYWLRSVNTSDVPATSYVLAGTGTSAAIAAAQLAAGIVDATKLATSITAPSVVQTLPGAYTTPFVTLAGDGKLYRWDAASGRYTATVAAVDVGVGLTAAQIASVNAAAVAGQISSAQIASLDAVKVAGTLSSDQIKDINAGKITGQIIAAQIASVAASTVTGVLTDNQLREISANKLVGQVVAAQVASVNANVVQGQLTASQLSGIEAAKVSGTLSDAQLAGISAGKVTGQIVDSQMATLSAGKVTGQLSAAQLAGIEAAKVSGQITGTQITDGAISTAKLQAASVVASTIAAGSIVASKLAIASDNLMVNGDVTQGLFCFSPSDGSVAIDLDKDWCPSGYTAVSLRTVNAPVGQIIDLIHTRRNPAGAETYYSVTAGQWYEISAYVSVHRCSAQVYIEFTDTSGNIVGYGGPGGTITGGDLGAKGGSLKTFPRCFVIVQAPNNAARARLRFRHWHTYSTVQSSTYTFWSAMQFCEAQAGQTEPSPYVAPGLTTITGSNILTNSIAATTIVANSLTTGQMQAGGINADRLIANSITAGQIASSTITSSQMAAGTLTAREIAVGSLSGDRIAANTIVGTQLVANTIGTREIIANVITSAQIQAGSISGDRLVANTITAGQIAAGSISGDRIQAGAVTANLLAAGAVTADKIGVGLNTGNLLYNSDFTAGAPGERPYGLTYATSDGSFVGGSLVINASGSAWEPPGMRSLQLNFSNQPTTGQIADIYYSRPTSDGGYSIKFPVTGGKWYELTGYISSHRCLNRMILNFFDANNNFVGSSDTNSNDSYQSSGALANWVRCVTRLQAPASAAYATITLRMTIKTNQAGPFAFWTGLYFGVTTQYADWSAWAPASQTVIVGGQIASNSLYADRIVAGSITGDRLAANSVTSGKVDAGVISAREIVASTITGDRIAGNTITGSNILAGTIGAREIVAGSITAGQIAGGTITGDRIAVRTIYGDLIAANTIQAGTLMANSITAAQIAAGAISTAQLAAGAVTADRLGVGLNTGNLLWNSDFAIAGYYTAGSNTGGLDISLRQDWAVGSLSSLTLHNSGSPVAGTYGYVDLLYPSADGSRTVYLPVQPGKTYEFSAYLSVHRCQGSIAAFPFDGSNFGAGIGSNVLSSNFANRTPDDSWRAKLRITIPIGCTQVLLRVQQTYTGETDAYCFASAPYFALVAQGTSTYSDYAPQSRTIITGGQLSANSITADKIAAGTITTDQLQAGSINADRLELNSLKTRVLQAGAVTADTITVGNGTLSSLLSGSNSTQINGSAISANSIAVNKLRIGNRGLNILGLNLRFVAATRQIVWDSGTIFWTDDNGNSVGQSISASSFTVSGGNWYSVVWPVHADHLDISTDVNYALNSTTHVTMATYDNSYSGLSVNYGNTIIDGDQIITGSIKANRIAANEIQSYHMAANSITGDRIVAGSLAADKITSGTITAGTIYLSDDRFWFDGPSQMIRIRNRYNGAEQVSIGAVGLHYGNGQDFGIICRNSESVEVFRVSGGYARMSGAIIDAASIGTAQIGDGAINNAKIGNLQVDSAKIADLTVGNQKITDLAATQVVASATSGTDTGNQGIYIRGSGKVVVLAFFNGASTQAVANGPGSLIIQRDGNNIGAVTSSFWTVVGNGNVSYYLNAMSIVAIDVPGAGSHNYRVLTTNAGSVGGVTLVVIECSK